jgi:hypothetical protein
MASKTDVANLAIGHLGYEEEIANVDSEDSQYAIALRRYHDVALQQMLRDYDWSFATRYAPLALVEEFDEDSDVKEWQFSYRYPVDCLKIRKIYSGVRNDSLESRVKYTINGDDAGRLVYTDEEDAEIIYTENVTAYGRFPPDFLMAFSFKWALYLPNKLLGGDPFKIKEELMQQYMMEVKNARMNDKSEQSFDEPLESEFIRTRD